MMVVDWAAVSFWNVSPVGLSGDRGYFVDVFEHRSSSVGDVVAGLRWNVCKRGRGKCALRLSVDQRGTLAPQDHERFFMLARGVPANTFLRASAGQSRFASPQSVAVHSAGSNRRWNTLASARTAGARGFLKEPGRLRRRRLSGWQFSSKAVSCCPKNGVSRRLAASAEPPRSRHGRSWDRSLHHPPQTDRRIARD